jgi:hypothetical protein
MGELEQRSGEALGQPPAKRRKGGPCGDQRGGVLPFHEPALPQHGFPQVSANGQEYRQYEGNIAGDERSPGPQEPDRWVI